MTGINFFLKKSVQQYSHIFELRIVNHKTIKLGTSFKIAKSQPLNQGLLIAPISQYLGAQKACEDLAKFIYKVINVKITQYVNAADEVNCNF